MESLSELLIRPIEEKDNSDLKFIIETVMPEFGANGDGFAITDPEVQQMYQCYTRAGHCYFVVYDDNGVKGGAGIAPLRGGDQTYCELQKMYFLKELRGLGFGQTLLELCLSRAKQMGYTHCYIETLERMPQAQKLYLKNGFKKISSPLGQTGHFGCDRYFSKQL